MPEHPSLPHPRASKCPRYWHAEINRAPNCIPRRAGSGRHIHSGCPDGSGSAARIAAADGWHDGNYSQDSGGRTSAPDRDACRSSGNTVWAAAWRWHGCDAACACSPWAADAALPGGAIAARGRRARARPVERGARYTVFGAWRCFDTSCRARSSSRLFLS